MTNQPTPPQASLAPLEFNEHTLNAAEATTNSALNAASKAGPSTTQQPPQLPFISTNAKSILPRKYIVHRHSQICKNCGTLHEWSVAYAYSEMMTRTGAGKAVIHLVPISEFSYNLPISTIAVERKTIAACHECATSASLSHLPDPTTTEEWQHTFTRESAPETGKYHFGSASSKPRTAAKPKTIDDLLF